MITKNEMPISQVYKMDKKTLGSGTYGIVNKVQHKISKQIRACKTIPRSKVKNWTRFETEIKVL